MQDTDSPTKIPLQWAASAGGAYITYPVPTPSQIGITNGAASWTDGFPPNNFIPLGSGGAGPFGKDFNGMLRQTTAGVQWLQAGGPIQHDATFSTEIGGYPRGAVLSSDATLGKFWISTVDNNSSDPDAAGPNWAAGWFIGTGDGSLLVPQYNVMISNSPNLPTGAAPGTAGQALVSTGAASNPAFGSVNLGYTVGGTQYNVLIAGGPSSGPSDAAPGTAGIALVSTGAASNPAFGALNLSTSGSVIGKLPLANSPSTLLFSTGIAGIYTFTVPANTTAVFVMCQGAGASGAATGATYNGGGGGAGGLAFGWITGLTPLSTITITIGAGGASVAPGNDGNNGGSSSVGAYMSATGGFGGQSTANGAGGGAGAGTVAGGPPGWVQYGGEGGDGCAKASGDNGGNGGASYFGGGGRATKITSGNLFAPGAGGGGSYDNAANSRAGSDGAVLIWG